MITALDCLPHPFWMMDRDGRYELQNRLDRQGFGDLVGKHPRETGLDGEMLAVWERQHAQTLAGEIVRSSMVKQREDGGRVASESTMAPIVVDGAITGLVGIALDHTDRFEAESAQRDSERRLRDFLATTSDWLWETDAEHRFSMMRDEGGKVGHRRREGHRHDPMGARRSRRRRLRVLGRAPRRPRCAPADPRVRLQPPAHRRRERLHGGQRRSDLR